MSLKAWRSTGGRLSRETSGRTAKAVVAATFGWVGTPYRHQGGRKGVACDCLGLVRGVWRELYGRDLDDPGPYSADWAEAEGDERLLMGLRRNFVEKPVPDIIEGDVIVFRWRPHLQAKHAGIMVGPDRFAHAYQDHGVVVTQLVPQWRRRIAAAFTFPE